MRFWTPAIVCAVALVAGWGAFGSEQPSAESADQEATRLIMVEIFESIRFLLPLSVEPEGFRSPERETEIRAALGRLAAHAAVLGQHAAEPQPSVRLVGRALDRDARETLRMYDLGRFESAQFYLQQMTEYCVACHTRLPSPGDSPLSKEFIAKSALSRLPLTERAILQMATRQFDEALVSFEAIFESPERASIDLLAPLTDYLVVCLRVKEDFDRPLPVLRRFAKRPDLWRYLRADVERWIDALNTLGKRGWGEAGLESARQLIDEARRGILFPADRHALVHYIVASSVLHRYVESHSNGNSGLSEAYYLLGLTETRIGRDYWFSQADFFLETSVRLAPDTESARLAYALLEEETILSYTGSSGTRLPVEVEQRLAELRRLIDAP
jgi:tetratricopeptide (TPR) repeat protein